MFDHYNSFFVPVQSPTFAILLRLSSILFLDFGAGTLAQPTIDENTSSLEKRIRHTGWIASYATDDDKCEKPYILGADRPVLQWEHMSGNIMPVNFTLASGTDNAGKYFDFGSNRINEVASSRAHG